jgi:hypothetical protein
MWLKRLRRIIRRGVLGERGASGPEAAAVLPVFFMIFAAIMGLSIAGFTRLMVAARTPLAARDTGAMGVSAGYAILERTAGITQLGRQSLGEAGTSLGSEAGCHRSAEANVSVVGALQMPFLPRLSVPLRGGSMTRWWQFWAGPTNDVCD